MAPKKKAKAKGKGSQSGKAAASSSSSSVVQRSKDTSAFWDELKRNANMMDDMLFIKAEDLRKEVEESGNEDDIELMRVGFVNLQSECGKIGWIDGLLPEGLPPTLETSAIEALAKYAALPAPPTVDDEGVPLKRTREEIEADLKKRENTAYTASSVATHAPNRSSEEIMFLSKLPCQEEGSLSGLVSRGATWDALFYSGRTAASLDRLKVDFAILQNGVFSIIRNSALDELVLSVADPAIPPPPTIYAADKLSIHFTNMLTFPKPVKKFKMLLSEFTLLKNIREMMTSEVGLSDEEDLMLYWRGQVVPVEKDSTTIAELGLVNGSKVIISKRPVKANNTGKRGMSERNRQFVGDLLFSMGMTPGGEGSRGDVSIVDTFKVSHGYQIIGRALERIILTRFSGMFVRDRQAMEAESDLLALLEEEEEKQEKKKDKKKKQSTEKASAKETIGAATDDAVGTALKEAEDAESSRVQQASDAAAAEKHAEKVKKEAEKVKKEAEKVKKEAEKVKKAEREAARAHELYMKKLADELREKEKLQEEELAKAKALSLAQQEAVEAAEKRKEREKEKIYRQHEAIRGRNLTRAEKNAIRKDLALAATKGVPYKMPAHLTNDAGRSSGRAGGNKEASHPPSIPPATASMDPFEVATAPTLGVTMPAPASTSRRGPPSVESAGIPSMAFARPLKPAVDSTSLRSTTNPRRRRPGAAAEPKDPREDILARIHGFGGTSVGGDPAVDKSLSIPLSSGVRIGEFHVEAHAVSPRHDPAPLKRPLSFCTNCGIKFEFGHKFCGNCGNRLPSEPSSPDVSLGGFKSGNGSPPYSTITSSRDPLASNSMPSSTALFPGLGAGQASPTSSNGLGGEGLDFGTFGAEFGSLSLSSTGGEPPGLGGLSGSRGTVAADESTRVRRDGWNPLT